MLEPFANHLWESTLLAVGIAVLVRACRANAAGVRHALWLTASLKFFVPFALLAWCGSQLGWLVPGPLVPARAAFIDGVSYPFSIEVAAPALSSPGLRASGPHWWPLIVGSMWFAGCAAVVVAWLAQWRRMSALARRARPLDGGRTHATALRLGARAGLRTPLRVALSSESFEPGIFGIRRPLLLWPQALDARLDDRQAEAIVAHEVAHVRRRDNFTALLHMVVQAVFWFHPLVWWIGARLVEERERACDETVIRQGHQPEVYAEGLLRTCRFCVESPLTCIAGISGADLRKRVTGILHGAPTRRLGIWRTVLLGVSATLALLSPIVSGAVAQTSEQRSEVPTGLRFESVSVKRADPDDRGRVFAATLQTGRLRLVNLTLAAIVRAAYGVEFPHAIPEERVSGGPEWMESDRFTLEATAGRPVTPSEMAGMLRSVLTERFALVARIEQRQLPVFHLTAATPGRPGPNLRASEVDCSAAPRCGIGGRAGRFLLSASPMSLLAENLTELTGRPVFDRSGLDGPFDGVLEWAPAPEELLHFGGADRSAPPQPPDPGASLYTALEDQFGLRLIAARGPVDFLVIESASPPSEN